MTNSKTLRPKYQPAKVETTRGVEREAGLDDLISVPPRGESFDPGGADAEPHPRRLAPTRGPVHRFVGRLIAESTSHKPGKDRWQECRLWETEGGAWITELVGASDAGPERDIVTVTVVEPGADEDARKLAVMDGFEWTTLARSMVRRQLRWKLERVVE